MLAAGQQHLLPVWCVWRVDHGRWVCILTPTDACEAQGAEQNAWLLGCRCLRSALLC